MMNRLVAFAAALALLCLGGFARANVFDLGPGYTKLETVTVGNPGNTGELSGAGAAGYGINRVCGAVSYTYEIGKYEVTAAQYCDFLNHKAQSDPYGLWNPKMDWTVSVYGCNILRTGVSGSYSYSIAAQYANRPVNYVSYWDACRFSNWLCNGQGDGDTETGAYTLNGYNGSGGQSISRNAGWTWAVTSEDEWYKAAYYKGNGTYWDYPTCSNTMPGRLLADPSSNNANSGAGLNDPIDSARYYTTVAGQFHNSPGPYGTFDQGGNLWEWNESVISDRYRGIRGGSWYGSADQLQASIRYDTYNTPTSEVSNVGFRVVQVVPEPSSIVALLAGLCTLGGLVIRRRRS